MVPPAGTTVRADRLRALNVPQPVIVVCDEIGTPVKVKQDGGEAEGAEDVVTDVLEAWLVHDEWWRPPGVNRRYVEVILECGAHVILFEDLNTHAWFLQSA